MCGTTNQEDAMAAVEAGVDSLGFIFFEKSPRNVEPDTVRYITGLLPPFISTVGVFVDRPINEVVELVRLCRLSHVQLHGEESPQYCSELAKQCGCFIVKAFRVGPKSVADDFSTYEDVVNGYLLDTYKKGVAGGTGESFDWQLIEKLYLRRPIVLAGGLSPENVVQAVKAVGPYGIDINSGVEKAPGEKDHKKLRELIGKVRALEADK